VLDLTTETPLPLKDACALIPPARRGRRTHLSTILRWVLQGARSPSGERVRLEAVRLGSRWVTSREALQRFAERLTPQAHEDAPHPAPRTPASRRRAADRVGRELERLGM
jgi:hypothetical protein